MGSILNGVVIANVTPFRDDGALDLAGARKVARHIADRGFDALYPLGTNGEGIFLTVDERKRVAEAIVDEVSGRIPVVLQCTAGTLPETRELLLHAREIGADAAGIMTPYFFRHTQEALEEFYDRLLDAAGEFPAYIYNIPSHTNNDILPETVRRLAARHPNLKGVKYSHPSILRISEYIAIGDELDVLIGGDRLIRAAVAVGGRGGISGPAVLFPEVFTGLRDALRDGDDQKAKEYQALIALSEEYTAEFRSIPLMKVCLKEMGVIKSAACRAPFGSVGEEERARMLQKVAAFRALCERRAG